MREVLLLGASLAVILASPSLAQKTSAGGLAGASSAAGSHAGSGYTPPVDLAPDAQALLAPWTGPYGGLPPFTQVKVSAFQPALEEAMRENLVEIDAIASNPAPSTFDNTIAAQERAGKALGRVMTLYGVWGSTR